MKAIMKEVIPKLVFWAIVVSLGGIGYTLQWGHAHAEDKVNDNTELTKANTERADKHDIAHQIDRKQDVIDQIDISGRDDQPKLVQVRYRLTQEIEDLRNGL